MAVNVGADEEGFIVSALQLNEALRFGRRGKETFPVIDCENLVVTAVKDEQWRAKFWHLVERIILGLGNETNGEKRKHLLADISDGGERFFEDETSNRHFDRQVHGNGGAE